MPVAPKKYYAYVDESGQDTKGLIFIVSVLILEENREQLLRQLELIEQRSGKGNVKWHKARNEFRQVYIEEAIKLPGLHRSVFFDIFKGSGEYLELTALATAKAVLKKVQGEYKVTVFVDGLNRQEVSRFTKSLRDLHIRTRKIRGVRRDENDAFIRFVDSICGLVRDAHEGRPWASETLDRMKQSGLALEL